MIMALYGRSCVGKTTIARSLSGLSGIPLRSCGGVVRARAASIGVSVVELSEDDHRQIDAATIRWAREQKDCIVEGRFLDAVFATEDLPLILIEITASPAARVERARERHQSPAFCEDDLKLADTRDAAFVSELFEATCPCVPWRRIDTSNLTVVGCTQLLQEIIVEERCRARA